MQKWGVAAGVCLLAGMACVFAQDAPKKTMNPSAQLKRGKYLVESVGMCADCHTPFNEQGQPLMEKHLQGAMLMFKPTVPVPGWVEKSANIAGLKGWTDDEAIKFLTTGVDPNGKHAGPPMPQFRYNKRDAAAIVAYLRSLAPASAASSSK